MTRWVGRVFAWLGVICLMWILDLETGVAQGGPSVGSWSNPVSTSFSVFPSPSPLFIRTRADAVDSFALHRACATPGDWGPPWLDSRGPPATCERPWVIGKPAGHAGSSTREAGHVFARKFPASTGSTEKTEFCNSL